MGFAWVTNYFFSDGRPVIAAYTPRETMGVGQGVSFTGLGIGLALGVLLAGVIAQTLGWRWVFYLYSIPPMIAALALALIVREPPRTAQVASQDDVPYRE